MGRGVGDLARSSLDGRDSILTTKVYCWWDLVMNSDLHSPMHRLTGPEVVPTRAWPISQTILRRQHTFL